MTAYERTGYRDLWPSTHHRQLPRTFPRSDIDAVWSNWTDPIALVEEKHHRATWTPDDYGIAVMRKMASGYRDEAHPNGLPALVVQYEPEQLRFTVTALNDEAAKYLQPHGYVADVYPFEVMLEARYVEYQAQVRRMSRAETAAAVEHLQRQPLPERASSSTATISGELTYTPQAQQQRYSWQQRYPLPR